MKLNRKQEEALIMIAINNLLENQIKSLKKGIQWADSLKPRRKKKAPWNKGRKWSREQHRKFRTTMSKVWEAKRNGKK